MELKLIHPMRYPRDVPFASSQAMQTDDDRVTQPALSVISPKRSLPGSRAIVGGLLVAVAFVGTYAAATGLTGSDTRSVLVVTRDLPTGARIEASDVRVVQTELGSAVAGGTIASPGVAIGTTLTGPVKSGEILQAGSLTAKAGSATQPEMSFSIPSSRALGNTLSSGETVDVLVSDKGGSNTPARVVVSNVTILKSSAAGNSALGASGDVTITVAVDNRADAAALAGAIDTGQVTLVRTTGLVEATTTVGAADGA